MTHQTYYFAHKRLRVEVFADGAISVVLDGVQIIYEGAKQ